MYFILKDEPIDIIEKKFAFKLPSLSKVEQFTYDKGEDYFAAKILIPNHNIDYIKHNLNNFFNTPP